MTIRFCPASPLRSLHKAFPPIVFNDVHAFAKSDWCPGPSLAGCPVGRLGELEVFDPSQVLYDVLAIGIPHVDAISKTRAIVYRHFFLPQSSSAVSPLLHPTTFRGPRLGLIRCVGQAPRHRSDCGMHPRWRRLGSRIEYRMA